MSEQLYISREDGVRVLRGPELRGAALQPHLAQARGPGAAGALVQERLGETNLHLRHSRWESI